jgi:uncharacterized membrane protein YesL
MLMYDVKKLKNSFNNCISISEVGNLFMFLYYFFSLFFLIKHFVLYEYTDWDSDYNLSVFFSFISNTDWYSFVYLMIDLS